MDSVMPASYMVFGSNKRSRCRREEGANPSSHIYPIAQGGHYRIQYAYLILNLDLHSAGHGNIILYEC
jgi:hypothetical protein